MANILTAIKTIYKNSNLKIDEVVDGSNMMNDMGEGLENYIKNAFADIKSDRDKKTKIVKYNEIFSYLGSKNTPPDMILKCSDAIEVKKVESASPDLQLNSSHPKDKIHSNNLKISKGCRVCEDKLVTGRWNEKDIIYTIGHVLKNTKTLKSLWMIYGDCYAANANVYTKAEEKISNSMKFIPDLEFDLTTKELGRVKNVDPLNISSLRVRGMWIIQHPKKVFDYVYEYDKNAYFQLITIMKTEKYNSFPESDRKFIEDTNLINVKNIEIQDPNNTAKLITIIKSGES